ncbi:hypothetical protein EV384_3109 [Micromonospora kangleipakensis]|uniref:Uncharacterized protein n=1 Tax=Micromonospora kangleipakensis TaxID=1077942 RepID=A0A4Q8BA38_9ACTN|nr:hypothetical protein [Micromonospora kangleipakensis]RZU74634.1 hypothetical protein EV384_3109 [Micromonospora kangleipakensis]
MTALVVQRIRVRWTSRDAAAATVRGGVVQEYALPDAPAGGITVHDVLLDEATGYRPTDRLGSGDAAVREAGLWVEWRDGAAVVDHLPSRASYPFQRARTRLFSLAPGQLGRWRANFRFTGCACSARWWYEQWAVRVAHAPARPDLFHAARYARDVDHRVHLYGGPRPGRR